MAGHRKLGSTQRIEFTLQTTDFGETIEERQACLLGLQAAGVVEDTDMRGRGQLETHLLEAALGTLRAAREAGLGEQARQTAIAKRDRIAKQVQDTAEIWGLTFGEVVEKLEIEFPEVPE